MKKLGGYYGVEWKYKSEWKSIIELLLWLPETWKILGARFKKVILTHSLGTAVVLLDDKKELGPVADKEILTDVFGI